MLTPPPHIRTYMTPTPVTVSPSTSLADALRAQDAHGRGYVLVTQGDRVVGVLNPRDCAVVRALSAPGLEAVRVDAVMTPRTFLVAPDTELDLVVAEMVAHDYAAAVVTDGARFLGVVTAQDLLPAFAEALDTRLAG